MNEPGRDVTRRRRTRVGSVVIGYLGISWLILQVVDVVGDIVALPAWLARGVLVLLGIGLLFVAATAWIQADPETTRRERAGELPTDWQVAPKQAVAALLSGQFPHLTWGRTLLGGIVALSLLFGAGGVYVLVTNRTGVTGPLDPGSDGAIRVAAMPFTTTGPDLDVYREGMVELLATNLDGLGDIRAIASRTVLARWDEHAGAESRPDLETVLATARAAGGSHALVGSIVAAGDNVRLSAQLFDLATGAELPTPRAEGPATDILALVDELSVSAVRALLGSEEGVVTAGSRLASLTTSSVPALRLYLQAEALYRRAAFEDALPLLDRAIEQDPTFGLAVMRRAQSLGWLPTAIPPDTIEAARLAIGPLLAGMSQRDATLAEAGIIDYAERDPDGPRRLREFVNRYPDDAEGWYQLADFLYHLNDIRGGTRDEVLGGFDRAVELGPRFAPYYIHALEGAILRADSARTRELLEQYLSLAGEDQRYVVSSLALTLLFHPDTTLPADLEADADQVFSAGLVRLSYMSDLPQVAADLADRYLRPGDPRLVTAMLRAGRWADVRSVYSSLQPAVQDSVRRKSVRWAGAFQLDRSQIDLMWTGAQPPPSSEYWTDDPASVLGRLLAARDDGTGADPVLLAHVAELDGDVEQAEMFLTEESWREYGPAMVFRLAKLYERLDRPEDARAMYNRFLELWSGADPDLPPVLEAREAARRLSS